MNRKRSCCFDHTRQDGMNTYIEIECSLLNYDTSWMSSKRQGEMVQNKLLGRTNFVPNNVSRF